MADEKTIADVDATSEQAAADEPHGEQQKHETDWKAEARKWEQRAKENKAAADELEQLKQAQMTEQQKAEQRAEKAETELAQLRAEKQHAEDVREVADATGAPIALLECCADKAAMDKLASEYQELAKAKSEPPRIAPTARASRIVHESGKADTRDIFADFMTELMK